MGNLQTRAGMQGHSVLDFVSFKGRWRPGADKAYANGS